MTQAQPSPYSYIVRQVRRGSWTYDMYFHDEGWRVEYSVGECHSRRHAERNAKAYVRDLVKGETNASS